jgi:hypothetical protein
MNMLRLKQRVHATVCDSEALYSCVLPAAAIAMNW